MLDELQEPIVSNFIEKAPDVRVKNPVHFPSHDSHPERIIVGRPGDQPRPQDPEGPFQKLESFGLFDIFGRQVFYRRHFRESGLVERGP
jgi:hypothetical protein